MMISVIGGVVFAVFCGLYALVTKQQTELFNMQRRLEQMHLEVLDQLATIDSLASDVSHNLNTLMNDVEPMLPRHFNETTYRKVS